MQADTPLFGPGLRLHLVELFAKENDLQAVIAMAREAEAFILGSAASVRIPEISTKALAAGILAESERAAKLEAEISGPFAEELPPPQVKLKETQEPLSPPRGPVRPLGKPKSGWTSWTPELLDELERLMAAGLPYKEIAERLGGEVTASSAAAQASLRGLNKKYPRAHGGAPLFEPYPLDAPWPPTKGTIGASAHVKADHGKPKPDRDTRAQRKCLKCGKLFSSESAGNRICKGCTPAVNAAYEPASAKVGP